MRAQRSNPGFATLLTSLILLATTAAADDTAQPFTIQIERAHQCIQGHHHYISISKTESSRPLQSFSFLIEYNPLALEFIACQPGALLDSTSLEFLDCKNVDINQDSDSLAYLSINGQLRKGQAVPAAGGDICELKFYVTNDRAFECRAIPIRFVWRGCDDNLLRSADDEITYLAQQVLDYQPESHGFSEAIDISNVDCVPDGKMYHGGPCMACYHRGGDYFRHILMFVNGGIAVACADSIDRRGELTGGFEDPRFEVVAYINYLLYGDIVLDDPASLLYKEPDVNNDGTPLTVGDLIYMLRILTGDALPHPKLQPLSDTVELSVVDNVLTTVCRDSIGGIFLTLNSADSTDSVVALPDQEFELVTPRMGERARAVFWAGLDRVLRAIPPGRHRLLRIPEGAVLDTIQVCDYRGNLMLVEVVE